MLNRNYYDTLEIASDASQESIKEQYRYLLHAWHPDKFPNLAQKLRAQERTKTINDAYATLGDPQKRAQYDELMRSTEQVQPSSTQSKDSAPQTESRGQQAASWGTKSAGNFPVACQRCGCSDASLRWSVFPYVISIVILTFRRGWGGLYCGRCRRQEMLKAKLISFFLGWWGVPLGFFYTLGALFKSDEGDLPIDVNADYLKALGVYFLQAGHIGEALLTFNASLQLQYDPQLEQTVNGLFGRTSATPTSSAKGKGIGFTPVFIAIIALLVLLAVIASFISPTLEPGAPSVNRPTQQVVTRPIRPSATPTATKPPATPTATLPPPQDWKPYTSEEAHFSAYIPDKWAGSLSPSSEDNPSRGVSFAPSAAFRGKDRTVIAVTSVPMVKGDPVYSLVELKQNASKWMKDRRLTVIQAPTGINIAGDSGIWMIYERELTDTQYKLRGYAAMISTTEWFYFIEVTGLAQYDDVVHKYFDEFIKHFRASGN